MENTRRGTAFKQLNGIDIFETARIAAIWQEATAVSRSQALQLRDFDVDYGRFSLNFLVFTSELVPGLRSTFP